MRHRRNDGLGWILDFAVNPSDPNELVVGGSNGTRHTRDGDVTWVRDPSAGEVHDLVVDWSTRLLYVGLNGDPGSPFPLLRRRPLDSVGAWTDLAFAFDVVAARGIVLVSVPTPPHGQVWKSTNGGNSFTPVSTPVPIWFTTIVLAPDGVAATRRAYASSYDPSGHRLLRSDDDGATWTLLPGLLIDPSVHPMLAPDTRPLYRAWNRNQGGAPNHRYNTDLWSIVNSVLREGWILEGDVKTLAFACVPVE